MEPERSRTSAAGVQIAFDVRVYDEKQTASKNVTVKNYLSLDAHLI